MQDGELADGIQQWRIEVQVNGVSRPASGVEINADAASDLPDEVAGVSGVSARTGTITWPPQAAVSGVPATPWTRASSWTPQPGDTVDIWAGDAGTSWKIFTGRIDSNSGNTRAFTSKIIDATDQLDRPISLDPVAHTMPGAYDESTDTAREAVRTFVQPWHAAYRALRAGGFGIAAPTQLGGSQILDVDFQGSIWPTVGKIYDASSQESGGIELEWGDGWTYLSQADVSYTPRRVGFAGGQAVRVWLRWPESAAGGTQVEARVRQESGRSLRVTAILNAARTAATVTAQIYRISDQLVYGEAAWSAPVSVESGSAWVEVCASNNSDVLSWTSPATGVTPGTPNGDVAGTVDLGAKLNVDDPITLVGLNAPVIAARVGVLTLVQWQAMSSHTRPQRVHAWGRGFVNSQYVSRTQTKRNARDLLAEIGQATLTAMWIDELGVMQWVPTNLMYTGLPVREFTTDRDIFELGWLESLGATRHQILGSFDAVALKVANDGYTKTVHRPSGTDEIVPGTTDEFVSVPTDQEWFGVDTSMWRATSVADRFNERKGSFYAAIREAANDTYTSVGDGYTASMSKVTPKVFIVTHTNTTGATIEASTNPDGAIFRRSLRGIPMPIIRAQAVADFMSTDIVGSTTGPSWAADLSIDFDSWAIQGHAQAVCDWLSARLASPLITLTNVEVEYDPRIQLGDIVTVSSIALLGMSVNAVVVGKSETIEEGAYMTLTVRVIGTRTMHTTYAAFEAAYTGQNYAALESAWAGATWSGFENAPLGRI